MTYPVGYAKNEPEPVTIFRMSIEIASMTTHGSVTHWIEQAKVGDQQAVERLWERYFESLVRLARKSLSSMPRTLDDEEDVALVALNSFCQGVQNQKFSYVSDRDNLWRLLISITSKKVVDSVRRETRDKRGGGKVIVGSPFGSDDGFEQNLRLMNSMGDKPTPEFAAVFAEEFQLRLEQIDDEILRRVALMKMDGFQNAVIAEKLKCSTRTVERKLDLIRKIWCDK